MAFWNRKKRRQSEVDALFSKLAAAAFPGGESQIALESDAVVSLLGGNISHEEARDILVHAKGRALIAAQSASSGDDALKRCIESVRTRSQGTLSLAAAETVVLYVFQRLIDQQKESPTAARSNDWREMTKEEAMEVARITAYRIARRKGRTDPDADVRRLYNMDPAIFIMKYAAAWLTGDKTEHRKKIDSEHDARELAMDVTRMLVLAHFAEVKHTGQMPNSRELVSLAQEELERTLNLVRNKESVKQYSGFDVSEARAAHDLHVPFDIALTLGETGLLKDPSGPTDERRKIISDILG